MEAQERKDYFMESTSQTQQNGYVSSSSGTISWNCVICPYIAYCISYPHKCATCVNNQANQKRDFYMPIPYPFPPLYSYPHIWFGGTST